MKSDAKVLEYLNRVLKNEITAINQYFLHARMFKNWGFHALCEYEHKESVDEMKHADTLIERILLPRRPAEPPGHRQAHDRRRRRDMLACDLRLEMGSVPVLREGIGFCETTQDYISRDILETILEGEEEHIDWLETQLELIDKVGLPNYLQSKL
jgi:bacterioferritin